MSDVKNNTKQKRPPVSARNAGRLLTVLCFVLVVAVTKPVRSDATIATKPLVCVASAASRATENPVVWSAQKNKNQQHDGTTKSESKKAGAVVAADLSMTKRGAALAVNLIQKQVACGTGNFATKSSPRMAGTNVRCALVAIQTSWKSITSTVEVTNIVVRSAKALCTLG